jgi:trk system potassium uptake protein TrkA
MKIVIAGAGEVGCHLAKMLSEDYHDLTIIDNDEARLATVSETMDVLTKLGEPTSIEVLRSAGVAEADLFVAVSPAKYQDVNLISAVIAKEIGAKKVTARINNAEYLSPENKIIFKDLGIDLLF